MAKNRTAKSTFESKYGGGFVTPAQFISEVMCEHKAEKEGQGLNIKFWQSKKWGNFFKLQMRLASGLLRIYAPEAIIAALRRYEARRAYSLAAHFILDKLFDEEQAKFEARMNASQKTTEVTVDTMQKPKTFAKKSKLSKLRLLDGEKESEEQS